MIVYLLTSPSGKKYVGITSKTLAARWSNHCWRARRGSTFVLHAAIRRYGPESFKVEVIEETETWEEVCEREKFWIIELQSKAPNGYNLTDGGDGTIGFSQEVRDKMSASQTGKKHSDETRAKMSAAAKGRKLSEETRARMSAAAKSRPIEHRAKLSEAQKGRKYSDESRLKMSITRKGRKHTEEARAKMSKISMERSQRKLQP